MDVVKKITGLVEGDSFDPEIFSTYLTANKPKVTGDDFAAALKINQWLNNAVLAGYKQLEHSKTKMSMWIILGLAAAGLIVLLVLVMRKKKVVKTVAKAAA